MSDRFVITCGGAKADMSESLAMSREVHDTYPLTSLQQGMLFQWLLDPRAGINVEQLVCTLPEELDVDALRSALGPVSSPAMRP